MKSLTSLTLDLGNSPITSLAGLDQLNSLTCLTLNLVGSPITRLAGLDQLKSLTSLTLALEDFPIASLAGVVQLKRLTSLTCTRPGFSDHQPGRPGPVEEPDLSQTVVAVISAAFVQLKISATSKLVGCRL